MKIFNKREQINALRQRRKEECFSVINRGKAWYDLLSIEQEAELKEWYNAWLNVTETLVIPVTPAWVNQKLEQEDQII